MKPSHFPPLFFWYLIMIASADNANRACDPPSISHLLDVGTASTISSLLIRHLIGPHRTMTCEAVISYVVPNQHQTHTSAVSTNASPAITTAAPPSGPSIAMQKTPKAMKANTNTIKAQAVPESFLARYVIGQSLGNCMRLGDSHSLPHYAMNDRHSCADLRRSCGLPLRITGTRQNLSI